jgi:hypothetical protein
MFCPECGTLYKEGDRFCNACGHEFRKDDTRTAKDQQSYLSTESGPVKGFLVLILFIFTMPLTTLKLTLQDLKELGGNKKIDLESTEIPHLTWLSIAGRVLVSIAIFLTIFISIIVGLYKGISYSKYQDPFSIDFATHFIGSIIGGFIGAFLGAIAVNWSLMTLFEFLIISIGIANNIKKIAQK